METHKELPIHLFASYLDWLKWLEENHAKTSAMWVKFAKKGKGIPSITYEEAREGAIIYGWIDGLKNAVDETYYAIRFTPRKAKSGWSKVNCDIVDDLIRRGKMQPAGLAQVEAARADGRWDMAYDSQATMQVPADFQKALDTNPGAAEFWLSLKKSNQYAFLYRIQTTKKPELRAAKIEKYTDMLSRGEAFHLI